MATTDIAQQLIGFLTSNPAQLSNFLNHPYSTVQEATGAKEKLSRDDMSQVITATAAQATGAKLPTDQLAGIASALLSQNGGSVHSLTSALFGGAPKASATNNAAGLDLGALVNLAGALDFSKIDLTDGIGIDDVMGLFGAK